MALAPRALLATRGRDDPAITPQARVVGGSLFLTLLAVVTWQRLELGKQITSVLPCQYVNSVYFPSAALL